MLSWSIFILGGLLVSPASIASESVNLAAGGSGTSVRIDGNLDSWIALAIVATSLVTAYCLNVAAPKVRAMGTILASLGCFVVAGWFFLFVMETGILENPKPNQTPLDSAKPILLLIQGSVALIASQFLMIIGIRQTSNQEPLVLSAKNEPTRFGLVSRILHWTIAILFVSLIPMGIFASMIPEGTEYRNAYYVVHKTIGVLVLALVVIRLFWNMTSKRPGLSRDLKPVERKLAHGVHIALYGFLIALPVTGFVMTSYHGYPTFFFFWELAPLWEPSDMATIIWGTLHKYLLPYILYIVLGAHLLGALKHHYIDKHVHALKRMVG